MSNTLPVYIPCISCMDYHFHKSYIFHHLQHSQSGPFQKHGSKGDIDIQCERPAKLLLIVELMRTVTAVNIESIWSVGIRHRLYWLPPDKPAQTL